MNPIHSIDYIRILPELVLTAFGILVMMVDPLLKPPIAARAWVSSPWWDTGSHRRSHLSGELSRHVVVRHGAG